MADPMMELIKMQILSNKLMILFVLILLSMPVQAQDLTRNGADPTEVRTRIDIILSQLTSLAKSDLMGMQFGGDYALSGWLSVGADIPYAYARFSGSTSTGIGDMGVRFLLSSRNDNDRELLRSIAGGVEAHLNTGSAERGTGIGQTILIPHIGASFYLDEAFIIIPRIRYLFSVKEENNEIDEIRFEVNNVFNFAEDIWLELQPELYFDLKGERLGTMNLISVIGKMIDDKWGVSALYKANIFGEPRIDYLMYFSLRYLF